MKPSALLVAAAIAIVPGIAVAKDQHSAAKSKSQGWICIRAHGQVGSHSDLQCRSGKVELSRFPEHAADRLS